MPMQQRERLDGIGPRGPSPGGDSGAALAVHCLLAGLVGVAAMTAAEKLEQAVTGRPNSFVPGHTLERLLGLPRKPDRDRLWMNWPCIGGRGSRSGLSAR